MRVITYDKVTDIFCLVDEFCKNFEFVRTNGSRQTRYSGGLLKLENPQWAGFSVSNFICRLMTEAKSKFPD